MKTLLFCLVFLPTFALGGTWSDWYYKHYILAVLELKNVRTMLEKKNLHDPHLQYPMSVECGPETILARTADGTCNDLKHTMMGAQGMRFGRNVPLKHGHTMEDEIMKPNPRTISREFLTRKEFKPVPFLNLMAATWIQFMTHDWFSHGKNEDVDPFLLPLEKDDPLKQESMVILRTRFDRSRSSGENVLPVTYQNQVTHWWDGSQVYGSDAATVEKLRTHKDGLMKVSSRGLLEVDSDNIELTGFKDNWWVGLSLMHHLFTLEHNAIAKHLKAKHPDWNDQKLFDTARLVNAAVMAKIHTIEWTPAIIPNKVTRVGMNGNWFGLINPTKKVKFPFETKNPVLGGLVGGKKNLHKVPYAMTEEFVSIYRMHPLLPEAFQVRMNGESAVKTVIPLENTRNEKSHAIIAEHGLTNLFYSMGMSHPGQLVLNNFPQFMQKLDLPVVGAVDLGTMDIVRDRERGVPRYNQFRRLVGLKAIKNFEELTPEKDVVEKLKRVYENDVEKLDLMIGSYAEAYRPTGFGFGETTFQLFIVMAARRLQADRFFTENYNKKTYSKEGIKWVDDANMKKVILRHMPELAPALQGVKNAFSPWKK